MLKEVKIKAEGDKLSNCGQLGPWAPGIKSWLRQLTLVTQPSPSLYVRP